MTMKLIQYMITGAFVLLVSSCNDWLKVEPETSVDEEKLFSTEQGFRDALAGVYADMASGSLYGQELSFGLLDVLGQLYDYEAMETVYHQYHYAKDYQYGNEQVKSQIGSIWNKMYAVIAEINNILLWLDKNGQVMPVSTRHQIKGECLFLRAYLHYDLLRMFAPDVKREPQATAIPYVETFSVKATPAGSVRQVIENIKRDLNTAKQELEQDGIKKVIPYEFADKTETDRYVARANCYAVEALLARVLLDEGSYQEAEQAAANVIQSGKFRLLDVAKSINVQPDSLDILFNDEHIFSLRNKAILTNAQKLHLGIVTQTSVSGAALPLATDINDQFENNNNDVRLSTWVKPQSKYLIKYTKEDIKKFYPKQVLIKLSEMYLIVAECKMRLNEADALETLNTLRRSRIPNSAAADKAVINQDVLIAEMRREFIGEGKMFYEYKRLNSPILNILVNIEPSNSVQVFPLPEDEKEYGIYH
ncbi:hypothetical protein C3V39_04025 [Prevotella sp. oral taxon 820]|nr:hypothetical protein C3V39_04025 [Prevotella sp. oral taxon 820]